MVYTGTMGPSTHCHKGAVKVMEIGNASIWAGRWMDMNPELDWTLRIRLNDSFSLRSGTELIHASPKAKELLGEKLTSIAYPPTLDLDWEDFSVPSLKFDWWQELVDSLARLPKGSNVAVYCHGGHGRTGTALSILAGMSMQDIGNAEDVVDWVRHKYCFEAVESWSQIDYIESILNEPLHSRPTSALKASSQTAAQAYYYGTGAASMMDESHPAMEVEWENPAVVKSLAQGRQAPIPAPPIPTTVKNNAKVIMHELAKRKGPKQGGKKR